MLKWKHRIVYVQYMTLQVVAYCIFCQNCAALVDAKNFLKNILPLSLTELYFILYLYSIFYYFLSFYYI